MFPQGLYNMLGADWADNAFYRRADWQLKFLLWPRRCDLSNKWLWLCFAYKGTAGWSGPGEPAYEYRYHDTQEHLIWQLKRG